LCGCRKALERRRVENNIPVTLEIVAIISLATLLFNEPLNTL
jgi:hypothetical protein